MEPTPDIAKVTWKFKNTHYNHFLSWLAVFFFFNYAWQMMLAWILPWWLVLSEELVCNGFYMLDFRKVLNFCVFNQWIDLGASYYLALFYFTKKGLFLLFLGRFVGLMGIFRCYFSDNIFIDPYLKKYLVQELLNNNVTTTPFCFCWNKNLKYARKLKISKI